MGMRLQVDGIKGVVVEILEWDPRLDTSVPFMDTEHRQMYEIYSELARAVTARASQSVLYQLLFKLTTHAEQHFRNEAQQMVISGYPGHDAHVARHQVLLKEVADLTFQYGDNAIDLSARVLDYLRCWLSDHITTADREFATWIKASEV